MKQIVLSITLLSLLLTGCSKRETVITGRIDFADDDMLIYTVPLSGTNFPGFTDTLKIDSTRLFELKLAIDKSVFVSLMTTKSAKSVKLLIEPGGNYQVDIDADKEVKISGSNAEGQMLYASLPNPFFVEMELRTPSFLSLFNVADMRSLINETQPLAEIHEKITKLKQDDLDKFKTLADHKEISPSFLHLAQKDRDCYYASLEARFLLIKTYGLIETGNYTLENRDNLLEGLEKIYAQYPPDDKELIFSDFWREYAQYFIQDYQQFIQKEFKIEKLREMHRKGVYHTFFTQEAKKYLTGKALEFFQAQYICNESFQGMHEKELIAVFDQFQQDYPQSEYSRFLKPRIDPIVAYHQIIEQPFDKAMLFMDNYEHINTLEDAVKPLKGKTIYIDVWATWCHPCKEEFKNNDALKKFLAENDIQQLYISIDKEQNHQQWLNDIKYFHLTGTHIRANDSLSLDLMKRFDKKAKDPYVSIPWYILVDKNGKIIEEHAKSPLQLIADDELSLMK
jgi:thiol-disulfide isomerase/thioredoxin